MSFTFGISLRFSAKNNAIIYFTVYITIATINVFSKSSRNNNTKKELSYPKLNAHIFHKMFRQMPCFLHEYLLVFTYTYIHIHDSNLPQAIISPYKLQK